MQRASEQEREGERGGECRGGRGQERVEKRVSDMRVRRDRGGW